jgi:hypothetical protein
MKKIRDLENNLNGLMRESRKKDLFMKELNESSVFSMKRLNYFMHCHPMLVSSIFMETNLLILTYPLQTLKTRIQARHFKQDICHYIKNNVEKARSQFLNSSDALRYLECLPSNNHSQLRSLLYQQVC